MSHTDTRSIPGDQPLTYLSSPARHCKVFSRQPEKISLFLKMLTKEKKE